jgi:catechol 2,3-dioxygenase-like lactoylglutathione lyase family enzyme
MTRFAQVTPRLPVSDLSRTIAFYRDHFGFEVNVIWPRQIPTFAILRRDGVGLSFFESIDHQTGVIGYAELYIEVIDAQTLHDSLKTRLPIEWGPEVYSYGRREFAMRDPDGYLIIFTEPTNDPPTTSEPKE